MNEVDPVRGIRQVAHVRPLAGQEDPEQPDQAQAHAPGIKHLQDLGCRPRPDLRQEGDGEPRREHHQHGYRQHGPPAPAERVGQERAAAVAAAIRQHPEREERRVVGQQVERREQSGVGVRTEHRVGAAAGHAELRQQRQRDQQPHHPSRPRRLRGAVAARSRGAHPIGDERHHQEAGQQPQQHPEKPQVMELAQPWQQSVDGEAFRL